MILFTANAVLWWSRPAVQFGWAINSDWYIVRNLLAFSFLLGLPIFNAVIMGDPVIRDFRKGIDPLIFSKPVTRAQYLLGKFLGNFFVLVCCQAVFPLTQLVLQAFPTSRMIVLPIRVFPYFKHFFFFLVITHLVLAAFYFTVGTLTRNSKIVYGLATGFYPLYITYGLFLIRPLPFRWRLILDPMLLSASLRGNGFLHSAEFLNQYVVRYTADMIANRVAMILLAALCLAVLYLRFTIAERSGNPGTFSTLNLSPAGEAIYYRASLPATRLDESEKPNYPASAFVPRVALPEAARANEGIRSNVNKLSAALGVEFRLLRSERSLVVVMPLVVFLSILEVVFYNIAPDVSYSAAYATNTAKLLLLFVLGITVFYTGEAIHRDREVRIEPVLWAAPAANSVLLLSKFLATLLLACWLIFAVGLAAIAIQVLRNHTPIDLIAYFRVYGWILLPSTIFVTAVAVLANIVLRNKHVAYVLSIGTAAGLFYLYSNGYNHWLYNPVLHGLWTYRNLTGSGNNETTILIHRIYCLGVAIACLSLAHLLFRRKSTNGFWVEARFTGRVWSILLALLSLTTAIITGRVISSVP
jgi:ABC-type transport system involved in multi-copper enzyme maturation permease subunit